MLTLKSNAQDVVLVKGIVSSNSKPLPDVHIKVKSKKSGTTSNKKGKFSLIANLGDTIHFSHVSMTPQNRIVIEKNAFWNIKMIPSLNILNEEVVINAKSYKKEKLPFNKPQKIRTSRGIMDLRSTGVAVDYVKGEELNLAAPTIGTIPELVSALFAKTTNYQLAPDGSGVVLRSTGSINLSQNAIWDVDDMIYTGFPPPINLTDIKDLFVLKGLAATNSYGTLGAGGVIVVKTSSNENRIIDSRNISKKNNLANIFAKNKVIITENDLIIDKTQFNKLASELEDNISKLRELAYKYQAVGYQFFALQLFRKVMSLTPKDPQAYHDVAQVLWSMNKPVVAWKTYLTLLEQMDYKLPENWKEFLYDEMKNLYTSANLKEKIKDIFNLTTFKEEENGVTRIVFSWIDPVLKFDLQVVNPKGQSYTVNIGSENFSKQKTNEVFLIDNSVKGTWTFIAKPFCNTNNSLFLKSIIQKNWSSAKYPKQKQIQLFDFNDDCKVGNYKLFQIKNG
ncbi:carboxypeptidase-like regulatory domain-containing protein [Aquimarina sp. ERC-38]|uniref:carboxypeptidase-like regulatory domain-containing protein n=1 Tax=Aquimarina sp. ERC-38 TaxID=2949996 RepID=UPI002247DA1E|nr:carboxypeptidase-like regulatory domain-containing protein [Aquimarina sp. ERC-38]UZO82132.1 carboxypeptidase-like regulatory domain-containing protein [Aquimarina sp. ERC-38]